MPRPKRSKVAPSAPAPRVTKSTKSTKSFAGPIPESRASETGFNDMYDISDPDEGVVTSARRVKRGNGIGKASAARGQAEANARNLAKEDSLSEPGENAKRQEHLPPENQSAGADFEDFDLESSGPAVEVGRRERSTPGIENSLLALGNFRRRSRQPSILGRAAARARSSSVESNLAQDTGLTTVGKRNKSMLGNRHSRQPSVSGTTSGHVRSASIGLERGTPAHTGSIFDLGNFKRRARQPSILGTAQKDRQPRPEYDDEEDDFNPEDESTPLNLSKTKDMASSSSTSNPRKRKLSAAQVPQPSPPLPSDGELEPQSAIPTSRSIHESECEPHSSDEAPLPSVEAQDVNAEPMSETMAPPLSSSPSPEPASYRAAQRLRAEREVPRGRRRLRDRTPPFHSQDSPISSPPSLTHSPNYATAKAAPRAKRQAPLPSTFSTAQLQALLPRRRRRGARDPYDIGSSDEEIDVSGLASDDDELTHSTIRAPPSRRSIVPRIPPSGKPLRKSKAVPKPGVKRIYGARAAPTTSDKENEEIDPDDSLAPLPDDEDANGTPENSQELEKRVGKELKKAARKFEEVDKWELEFEECTASSLSPKDAR